MTLKKIDDLISRFSKEEKKIFGFFFDISTFPKQMDSEQFYDNRIHLINSKMCQEMMFNWYKLFESGKSGFQLGKTIVKGLFSKHYEDQFQTKNFYNYIDSIDINIDRCFNNFDAKSDKKLIHKWENFGRINSNKKVITDNELETDDGYFVQSEDSFIDFRLKGSIRITIIIKNMSNKDFQYKIEDNDNHLSLVEEIADLLRVPSDDIDLRIHQRDNSKKFKDLRNKKVDSLEKILKQIGRLSNNRLYEYSSEDFDELKKEIIQQVENNVFDPFVKALKRGQESSAKFKLKFDDEEKLPF